MKCRQHNAESGGEQSDLTIMYEGWRRHDPGHIRFTSTHRIPPTASPGSYDIRGGSVTAGVDYMVWRRRVVLVSGEQVLTRQI